jgi:hypothetical protein
MFKRFAFITAIIIIGLGILLIGLNVLDIDENYRLYLPIALLDTVFIAATAILVAYAAARRFITAGSFKILGLGGAVSAFGLGILVYGWFTSAALEVRATVYDTTFFMAALMHFCCVTLLKEKPSFSKLKLRQKQAIVLLFYSAIFAIIIAVTLLLYRGILPSLIIPRDLIQGVSAILCIVAAVICFRHYLKSQNAFYYWYSLGLMLFTFGVLFISQGALESRVAWLGRFSQYIGSVYFLIAVLSARQQEKMSQLQ